MNDWVTRRLPADIAVFAGSFGSGRAAQPLVFAHLLDQVPELDLDHVQVVPVAQATTRLGPYFDAVTIAALVRDAGERDMLILVLPSAHTGLHCPVSASDHLTPLGLRRGTVPRAVAAGEGR